MLAVRSAGRRQLTLRSSHADLRLCRRAYASLDNDQDFEGRVRGPAGGNVRLDSRGAYWTSAEADVLDKHFGGSATGAKLESRVVSTQSIIQLLLMSAVFANRFACDGRRTCCRIK
jgi:hypothetical protein